MHGHIIDDMTLNFLRTPLPPDWTLKKDRLICFFLPFSSIAVHELSFSVMSSDDDDDAAASLLVY